MKKVTAFLLLLALPWCVWCQQPAPVGIQLYSFRNQFAQDVRGAMQKVKDMGFTYVETAGFYGLSAEEFKKLLDEYGLRAVSTGADFNALQDQEKLNEIINTAKTLDAKFVTCFWIPHRDSFTYQDVERAVRVFNESGKTLRGSGISLLYHPHGYEFRPYNQGTLMDVLIQRTNPRFVNFQMDTYWVKHPGQDPVEWLKKYPKRWLSMHLKDRATGTPGNQLGRADVETNVVIGTGDLDFPAIMAQAQKNKIKYYFIEDESSRSLEQTPKSVEYLRGLMKKAK
jgi:sugar phosphate isomerase/epimerase